MAESKVAPIIELGEELTGRCAKLAAHYRKDQSVEEMKGPVELWIHRDESEHWFAKARAYVAGRFGEPSVELADWDRIVDAISDWDIAQQHDGNPYIGPMSRYRNATSFLKALPGEPPPAQAPAGPNRLEPDSSRVERWAREGGSAFRYVRRKVGWPGLVLFLLAAGCWLVITQAKEVREGLEAIGLVAQAKSLSNGTS